MRKDKPTHGGKRTGAGRKPAPRDAGKKLCAVWCWTTAQEQKMINTVLTADERTLILFQCVVAKQNGDDWWNNKAQGDDTMADKFVHGWYHYADGTDKEFRYPAQGEDNLKRDGMKVTVEVKEGGKWIERKGIAHYDGGNFVVTPR